MGWPAVLGLPQPVAIVGGLMPRGGHTVGLG